MLQLQGQPVARKQGAALRHGREMLNAAAGRGPRGPEGHGAPAELQIVAAGGSVLAQWQDAYNGIKVRIARREVGRLAAFPGWSGSTGSNSSEPDNAQSVPLHPGARRVADVGPTGAGMKVAIIDTGVDYTTPTSAARATRPTSRDDGSPSSPGVPDRQGHRWVRLRRRCFNAASDDPARPSRILIPTRSTASGTARTWAGPPPASV